MACCQQPVLCLQRINCNATLQCSAVVLALKQTAATESYRKHPLLQFVNVNLAGHALHKDIPDVAQNGFCGEEHQDGKDAGANGVSQLPP